jgi:hypothetical protein
MIASVAPDIPGLQGPPGLPEKPLATSHSQKSSARLPVAVLVVVCSGHFVHSAELLPP